MVFKRFLFWSFFFMILGVVFKGYCKSPKIIPAIRVVVPIEPIAYLVRQIGGKHVEILTLVSHQDNVHHYRILPSHLKSCFSCHFYFGLGGMFPFEEQLQKIVQGQNKNFIWVNLAEECQLLKHSHDHGKDEAMLDPHVWLSPQALIAMIQIITDTLVEYDSGYTSQYRLNSQALIQKIQQQQSDWKERCSKLSSKSFGVYHPAWGYFAREFGLNQIALEHHSGGITYQHLKKAVQTCLDHDVSYLIIEPYVGRRLRLRYLSKTMGVTIKALDPMAYTFLDSMEELVTLLESRQNIE